MVAFKRYLELRKEAEKTLKHEDKKPESKLITEKPVEAKKVTLKPVEAIVAKKEEIVPVIKPGKKLSREELRREKEIKKLRKLWYEDDV